MPPASLKRRRAASAPCEDEVTRNNKRSRTNVDHFAIKPFPIPELPDDEAFNTGFTGIDKGKAKLISFPVAGCLTSSNATVSNKSVIEELALELKCGCCTELCYNPVVVDPCQHYFCGSCCVLWVRHGGTNCPACRGISTSVTPSRVIQSMIDLLLRLDPSRARTENERLQADKVYKSGTSLILPTPRPKSPEPNLEAPNDNLARPCPTCLPGNPYGWQCPIPIQDPGAHPDTAFDLDDGTPPGHAFCGNCDQLHNIAAPSTTKCDFCQVSFCGIEIQTRCCALGLMSQQAHGLSDIPDIILNGTIYERFNENTVEVDIMLDYLRTNNISLRTVYRDIVSHIMKQPQGFAVLIDSGAFDDIHHVSGGEDPDPTAPRRRICRLCAAQVLIYGLKGWWIRERKIAGAAGAFVIRSDCPEGENCNMQIDPCHAKEFNHIVSDPYDASVADANVQVGPVAPLANANSVPSAGGSSSGPTSRDQSHNNVVVPRAIPFSILMPFPIAPSNPEGVLADGNAFNPLSEHTNLEETENVDMPFRNPSPSPQVDGPRQSEAQVQDGGANVSGSGASMSTVAAQNSQSPNQQDVRFTTDFPVIEGQDRNTFLIESTSASPYVSSDVSGLPTPGDNTMTALISSSSLRPVFPTTST